MQVLLVGVVLVAWWQAWLTQLAVIGILIGLGIGAGFCVLKMGQLSRAIDDSERDRTQALHEAQGPREGAVEWQARGDIPYLETFFGRTSTYQRYRGRSRKKGASPRVRGQSMRGMLGGAYCLKKVKEEC